MVRGLDTFAAFFAGDESRSRSGRTLPGSAMTWNLMCTPRRSNSLKLPSRRRRCSTDCAGFLE